LLDDLYRFARYLERTPADAEDLAQECLARALDRAHELNQPAALRVWLFRMMHRLHVDRRRSERSRGRLAVLRGGLEDLALFSVGDLDEDLIAREDARVVERALLRLPEHQRAALVLVDVWECTYEETADIVGVPIGTIRSRVARARARLEQELAAANEDPHTKDGSA